MLLIFEVIFWFCLFLVFYTYIGYGIVLLLLVKLKRISAPNSLTATTPPIYSTSDLPSVTLLVAAYNEEDYIQDKIDNSLSLDYPREKINFCFVTDGSNDNTTAIVKNCSEIQLLHDPARKGKIAAVERAMAYVDTEIVVFTDANTMLNNEALKNMIRHYQNPKVGAVAGEKRIFVQDKDNASGAGEGFYWKYESKLKTWDSELYSVVGAAGELFSIRTELFEHVPKDTLIEDFYMTLRIAEKGYRVIYEPDAYAQEGPSASVKDELKRKIRIAAGGIQAIVRLKGLLNIFKYGTLSFQYISHRVLRWTITPLVLPLIFILNIILAPSSAFYTTVLLCQIGFYILALGGYLMARKDIKIKVLFIPYYFCMMNYAVYRGMIRYFKGSQSVVWEKAKRASVELNQTK